MTETPLVSVIIPVYNAEKYLNDTFVSVQNQSYRNIEIILVDDGSKDSSFALCRELAQKEGRCSAYHKENGGASSARNFGLKHAKGEYIVFVDSDDFVPENGIDTLVNAITGTQSDYAAGSICAEITGKGYPCLDEDIFFLEQPKELLGYLTAQGSYSPYAKIFCRAVIEENTLYFDEQLKCSEDALFIRQYLKYCKHIRIVPDVVYRYNSSNANSLSKKIYQDFPMYYEKKLEVLRELVGVLPLSEEEQSAFLKERAVHGIKLSLDHYFKDRHTQQELLDYVKKTLTRLEKWTQNDGEIQDAALCSWWKKYSPSIHAADAEKCVKKLSRDTKIRNSLKRIKHLIKG